MRYPQDFFSEQAEKYVKYHMQDPQDFYNNEDLWAIPKEKFGQGADLQEVEPYYVIMRMPGEESEEFMLLLPYTPSKRQNLIGWLGCAQRRRKLRQAGGVQLPEGPAGRRPGAGRGAHRQRPGYFGVVHAEVHRGFNLSAGATCWSSPSGRACCTRSRFTYRRRASRSRSSSA